MRWLAPFVVACLLCAGASTNRIERGVDRPDTEIVPVKALAKIVVRRHDIVRGVAKLDLDPFVLAGAADNTTPPPHGVTVEHAVAADFTIYLHRVFDARGPPVG